jgi:hypothetical protein
MRNYMVGLLLIALGLSSPVVCQTEKAAPQVNAVFRSEVTRLASEGLKLREAFEVALEGNNRILAAIFNRPRPKKMEESNEFRLIESDSSGARTIFRRTDYYFSFTPAYASDEFARLNGTDINLDGLKDFIVQSSSGGNCWSCNPTEIYSVKNHKAELIAVGPVQQVADLDSDGLVELILTDARWENYDDFSHAASPATRLIYAWKDGRYVYASRDFASYYKAEIDRLKMMIEESKSQINAEIWSDETYVSSACSIAMSYAQFGEVERGLKEMEITLSSNARTQEQRARRARILEDFRRGESFRKLNEMKYGDAMPLG